MPLNKSFTGLILFFVTCNIFASGQNCENLEPYLIFCSNSTECLRNDTVCSSWCFEKLQSEVISKKFGIVNFVLPLPPHECCVNDYSLILRRSDDNSTCEKDAALNLVHSKVIVTRNKCDSNCTRNCSAELKYEAKYLYTGCYELEVKPTRPLGVGCISDRFYIETDYEKKLIRDRNIVVSQRFEQSNETLYTKLSFGLSFSHKSYPETVLVTLNSGVDLTEDDCVGEGQRESCCSAGADVKDCCLRLYDKEKQCSCTWERSAVSCTFENIKSGNYCLTVDVIDPRCDQGTLWANFQDCTWRYPFAISGYNLTNKVLIVPHYREVTHYVVLTAVVILASILSLLAYIYFRKYPKAIYRHYISFRPSVKKPVSIISVPKIIIIYPRDCNAFMEVMASFRQLLQDILTAEVYDIWDNNNWDNLAENGMLWAFNYITDPSIKVITIYSPLAKKIENSITCKQNIEYKVPHCYDSVYYSALRLAIDWSQRTQDQYNRFFVVRLDGTDCGSEFTESFRQMSPCTLYTLPQHLKDLILDMHDMETTEVIVNPEKFSRIQHLSHMITMYENFKIGNPNYLKNILD